MVVSLFLFLFTLLTLVYFLTSNPSSFLSSRVSVLIETSFRQVVSLFSFLPSPLLAVIFSLFSFLFLSSLLCNIPMAKVGSLYYFWTCSLSLVFWLSLCGVVFSTQLYSFLSHLLPFGSPSALSLFLPLVELFSQVIRPFTLIVRLSTNLSSGHIMLFMFSYFTLGSFVSGVLIGGFMLAILILELFISLLQAYIFTTLSSLYFSELV